MLRQSDNVPKVANMDNLESTKCNLENIRKDLINKCKQKLSENDSKLFEKEVNDSLRPDVIENEIKLKTFNLENKMTFIVNKFIDVGMIDIERQNEKKTDHHQEITPCGVFDVPFLLFLFVLLLPFRIFRSFLKYTGLSKLLQVPFKNTPFDIKFLPLRAFRSFLKSFDSEKSDTISMVVKEKGFEFEKHTAETSDGYVLEIHRIYKGDPNGKKVVFLQHGLMDSSATWIMGSAEESLGYILADKGFDVWLGNLRGNIYSKTHRVHKLDQDQFWDFTWEDMATKDLPSMIDYVLKKTNNPQLFYVGHSQGGLIGFVGFSKEQELCKKIKHFFALAPAVQLGNMKGIVGRLGNPLRHLNFEPHLGSLLKTFRFKFVNDFWYGMLGRQGVTLSDIEMNAPDLVPSKELFLNLSVGPSDDNKEYNERWNFIKQFYPAGTSVKNLLHFVQLERNAPKIKSFNYGSPYENGKRYKGMDEPPEFDVGSINMPLTVYYGENDSLVCPKDIGILQESIRNKSNCKFNLVKKFNHVDFVWSPVAKDRVYNKIIEKMNSL